ncbi:GNAT family N-acetyltransferase [Cuspidothrix issatschenkoi LEGE 03284]|uniref:GNAT family N-acetyltransferase n=1 Tax=Cuspidothrix issatschenkoi TaxID=230752 RepID=UPI0018829218|nr:GNAT family N-acetyltransferase [Cuspidothrix issatschenkoi]MBE9230478.1 GNAT family N-acetyltransferase [Cuspidothrix issatschenkoi LEGE 03284]
MPEDLLIRKGELKDLEILVKFNQALVYETEHKKLPEDQMIQGIETLLKTPSLGFYLVAQKNHQVVGSLMITTEWSDWRNGLYWWIMSVYVDPDFRRQGVFRKLYQFVKQEAQKPQHGFKICGFRLYVERDNLVAQKTYQSLGMEETAYYIYEKLGDF